MTVRIVAEAATPSSGMTLGELAEFCERAKALGCNTSDAVKATVTMRGRVKTVGLAEPGPR